MPAHPQKQLILDQMQRILASVPFQKAGQTANALLFIVNAALDGRRIKEYHLATEGLGKSDFDAGIDNVRGIVRDLRAKLSEYYSSEGARDSIRIELPRGSYTATFSPLHSRLLPESFVTKSPIAMGQPGNTEKIRTDLARPVTANLTLLAEMIEERCYRQDKGALRLLGSDTFFLTRSRVSVDYVHTPFEIPESMKADAELFINTQRAKHGKKIFDGPNTRLIAFTEGGEASHLKLHMAPTGWYDFVGLNQRLTGTITTVQDYEDLLGLSTIISRDDFSRSKLSTIFCSLVTLITRDGLAAYGIRSNTNYDDNENTLQCSVSENVNRYRDEVDSSGRLIRPYNDKVHAEDNTYAPTGVPHPFAAAERGIKEELSGGLYEYIKPNALKLSGIGYTLLEYQPNGLFIVAVDCSAQRVQEICRDNPGPEYRERIALRFTRPYFNDPGTRALLNDPAWDVSNKTSLLRAIELIGALHEPGLDWDGVFDVLANDE